MDVDFDARCRQCAFALHEACIGAGITPAGDGRVTEAIAADLLQVSVRTMQRWREDGCGPMPTRIGSRIWYALPALARFIELGVGHENAPNPRRATPKTRHPTTTRDSTSKRA